MATQTFLLGAASGACATALAAYLLYPAAQPTDRGGAKLQPQSAAWSPSPFQAPSASSPAAGVPPIPPPSATLARSTQPPLEPQPMAPQLKPAPLLAQVPLSAEHVKVLTPSPDQVRPPSLAELHMQLLAEGKDQAWAPDLEQSIRASLTASNASAEFEIMSVECRQSLCEILAFGNLPTSGQRWNEIWDQLAKQPRHSNIRGNSTSTIVQNERFVIITILHRAKRG